MNSSGSRDRGGGGGYIAKKKKKKGRRKIKNPKLTTGWFYLWHFSYDWLRAYIFQANRFSIQAWRMTALPEYLLRIIYLHIYSPKALLTIFGIYI